MRDASRAGYRGHLLTAVLAGAAAFAAFAGFYVTGGGVDLRGGYQLNAIVPTSASVTAGSRVTMAGVRVGRITGVRRSGAGTAIEMHITDDRVVPLPADSRVTLRQRTPVGENYVSITPGSSTVRVPSGGALRSADEYVDLDQILSILSGPQKARARALIQGTAAGVRGRGDGLNELLGGAAGTLSSGSGVLDSLAVNRQHVAQLVVRLGAVSSAVGERAASVRVIADKGLASLRAVARRDQALSRLLGELPGTLDQVRATSTRLSTVSRVAAPVVANLAAGLKEVRPAVRSLRPAAQEGRAVVRGLSATAPGLGRTLRRAQSLSAPLAAALPQLRLALCQVNPAVRYLKPYAPDLSSWFIGLGSASNSYDAIGHLIRLTPIVNENSVVGLPDNVSRAAHTLLRAGFLSKVSGLTLRPYPQPGMVGKDAAGPGDTLTGPADVAASGYRFPHVEADC
ncbi:MAG: virulence factor Mce family protein [Solirubrobacterales bacterium]|nr:virulence factor Mce family protein [Solirubrobacterales bacterium]